MNATFDYTGRNVFVTGGGSGINLGIAKRLRFDKGEAVLPR